MSKQDDISRLQSSKLDYKILPENYDRYDKDFKIIIIGDASKFLL